MGIMEALYWSAVAAALSYMTALFSSQGTRASLIGVVAVAATGGAFAGQFVLGNAADRLRSTRKVFAAGMLLSVPLCFAACMLRSFPVRIVCIAFTGFFQTPCAALLDTWVLLGSEAPEKQYGPIRAAGSAGYAVFSVLLGLALSRFGYGIIPWTALGCTLLLLAVALGVPDIQPPPRAPSAGKRNVFSDLRLLLREKELCWLYASLFLCGLGVSSVWNILPLLLENVGGGVSQQGLILFLATMVEAVFVLMSRRLDRVRDALLVALGSVAAAGLMLGAGFSDTIPGLVCSCLLRGLSYAFTLLGMRKMLLRLAPADVSATAQTMGDALNTCLGSMLGGLSCGILLEYATPRVMALCCAAAEALSVCCMIPVLLKKKN